MTTLHDLTPAPLRATKVLATLRPKNMGTLRPQVLPFIGTTHLWTAGWTIDDEDDPQYAGMLAFVAPPDLIAAGVGWVPACDLVPADV